METESCARGCIIRHRHLSDCPDNDLCGGCLPRPADRGRLCQRCHDRARIALEGLPEQWAQLAARLTPEHQPGEVVGGSSDDGRLPIDPRVAEHRDQLRRVLVSWAMQIADERRIAPPRNVQPTVVGTWLIVHYDWATDQDWAGDYADELLALSKRAYSLLYPSGRRTVELGGCPVMVPPEEEDADPTRCEGSLSVSVARTDDLLPKAIVCSHNPEHSWAPGRPWVALGELLHGRPV